MSGDVSELGVSSYEEESFVIEGFGIAYSRSVMMR